jgi:hypothetical protein
MAGIVVRDVRKSGGFIMRPCIYRLGFGVERRL